MEMLKRIVLLVFVASLLPASAYAQAGEEGEDFRVVVVPLDERARSGSLMQTVSGLLDGAKFDVVVGERLEKALDKRQVPPAKQAVAAKFAGLSSVIADGVEKFFYKGNQAAVDRLSPIFDLGMGNLPVLARRPDFAAQIYQAGLVMVRAYKNLGQEENARAVAQVMARMLPGLDPSPAHAPPKIIRFIKAERDRLAEEGSSLRLELVDGENCTGFINGTPVEDRAYPVAAGTEYLVTMDCGASAAPVWKISPDEGQQMVVPVAPREPTRFSMANGDFLQRRMAEAYLRLVSFWTGAPRVIGVARALEAKTDESVLFVRVAADGKSVWSDGNDERAISRGLARVLPEYRQSVVAGGAGAGSSSDVDWLSWSLVGGGVALAGVGTWAALAAEERALELQCSPDTDYETSPGECEEVPTIAFADQAELDAAESEVTWARIAGYGSIAAGVGLAAWGTWRLVSSEAPVGAGGPAVSVGAQPLSDGGYAHVRWRF